MTRRFIASAAVLLAIIVGSAHPAGAVIPTTFPVRILILPTPPLAPTTPAPLPPPINPGYAAAPQTGLSPALSQSVPLYQLPQQAPASYPPPQLPGPIDQQKMQAFRNDLRAQLWQRQWQSVNPATTRSREIQQQLNPPDWQ